MSDKLQFVADLVSLNAVNDKLKFVGHGNEHANTHLSLVRSSQRWLEAQLSRMRRNYRRA